MTSIHDSLFSIHNSQFFVMKQIFLISFFIFAFCTFNFSQTGGQAETWNDPVEPFRIAGNIYYVGAYDVTSYLIVTRKGHILIDSGLPETVPQIKANIAKLGFKLEDVKIILNSHAHYDHAGGIAELKRLTKATLLTSEKDSVLLARGGLDDPNYGDRFPFEPVRADNILKDGQKVKLGGSALKANFTPGHTPGCTTWTASVKENNKTLNVIFVCSTSAPGYTLVDNKKYPDIEADYVRTFARLKKAKVDVFLASHGNAFDLADKAEKLRKGGTSNPFIDPEGFKSYVDESEKAFLERLKTQKAEKK